MSSCTKRRLSMKEYNYFLFREKQHLNRMALLRNLSGRECSAETYIKATLSLMTAYHNMLVKKDDVLLLQHKKLGESNE